MNPKQPNKVLLSFNGKPIITSEQFELQVKEALKNPLFSGPNSDKEYQDFIRTMVYENLVKRAIAQEWVRRNNIQATPEYKQEMAELEKEVAYKVFEASLLNAQEITSDDLQEFYESDEDLRETFADEETGREREFSELTQDDLEMLKSMLKDEIILEIIDEMKEEYKAEENF